MFAMPSYPLETSSLIGINPSVDKSLVFKGIKTLDRGFKCPCSVPRGIQRVTPPAIHGNPDQGPNNRAKQVEQISLQTLQQIWLHKMKPTREIVLVLHPQRGSSVVGREDCTDDGKVRLFHE
jgi:hypothetical protein